MADNAPHTLDQILKPLETWFEIEFTFLHVHEIAAALSRLPREEQDFFLNSVIQLETHYPPEKLLEILLDIETEMGRTDPDIQSFSPPGR